jgi:hypothetical protein
MVWIPACHRVWASNCRWACVWSYRSPRPVSTAHAVTAEAPRRRKGTGGVEERALGVASGWPIDLIKWEIHGRHLVARRITHARSTGEVQQKASNLMAQLRTSGSSLDRRFVRGTLERRRSSGIWKFESCRPSQAVPPPRFRRPTSPKSPPIGRYLTSANSLRVPKCGKGPATSPDVSTDSLNYSRFLESPIGDYFDHRTSTPVHCRPAAWCELPARRWQRRAPPPLLSHPAQLRQQDDLSQYEYLP